MANFLILWSTLLLTSQELKLLLRFLTFMLFITTISFSYLVINDFKAELILILFEWRTDLHACNFRPHACSFIKKETLAQVLSS